MSCIPELLPSDHIKSIHNEKIKLIRALNRRKIRRQTGLFIAEGLSVVTTAIRYDWIPQFILMSTRIIQANWLRAELSHLVKKRHVACLQLSESLFEKIATRNNPQDLIAVFVQRWHQLPEVITQSWVVLENVRDPGNLGTIIRTVDATGVGGIILVGNCCDPYAREAVRASMGSIFHVPLIQMDIAAFLQWCRIWPGDVIGAHVSASKNFRQSYKDPVLIIMGSEGSGLSANMMKACAQLVRIPMMKHIDSLNLAIATALMIYEIRRDVSSLNFF